MKIDSNANEQNVKQTWSQVVFVAKGNPNSQSNSKAANQPAQPPLVNNQSESEQNNNSESSESAVLSN